MLWVEQARSGKLIILTSCHKLAVLIDLELAMLNFLDQLGAQALLHVALDDPLSLL